MPPWYIEFTTYRRVAEYCNITIFDAYELPQQFVHQVMVALTAENQAQAERIKNAQK